MDLHYTNNEFVILLTTQDDLDKAVKLLDRSTHVKSLKILLVVNGSTQATNLEPSPSPEDMNNTQPCAERKKRLSVVGPTSRDRSSSPPGYISRLPRMGHSQASTVKESSLQRAWTKESYPKSRMPRAQSYPDNHQECSDYDNPTFEKFGKEEHIQEGTMFHIIIKSIMMVVRLFQELEGPRAPASSLL